MIVISVVLAAGLGYGCHACVMPQLKRIHIEVTK